MTPASAALLPGYALRRATLRDLPAIHRLEQAIFPRDAYPYIELLLLLMTPGLVNLKITAVEGTLAGFVSVGRGRRRDRAWIITLGVARAHQQRGLGRALLCAAEARMHGRDMLLTVREGNAPAISLYQRCGYDVIERQPGYYNDGEAGLVMMKPREVVVLRGCCE